MLFVSLIAKTLNAFCSVLIVWLLWAYNMGFGEQWFPFLGKPGPVASSAFELAFPR